MFGELWAQLRNKVMFDKYSRLCTAKRMFTQLKTGFRLVKQLRHDNLPQQLAKQQQIWNGSEGFACCCLSKRFDNCILKYCWESAQEQWFMRVMIHLQHGYVLEQFHRKSYKTSVEVYRYILTAEHTCVQLTIIFSLIDGLIVLFGMCVCVVFPWGGRLLGVQQAANSETILRLKDHQYQLQSCMTANWLPMCVCAPVCVCECVCVCVCVCSLVVDSVKRKGHSHQQHFHLDHNCCYWNSFAGGKLHCLAFIPHQEIGQNWLILFTIENRAVAIV